MNAKIDPKALSVANMQAYGVELVSASCWSCQHMWRSPIMMLPPETTVAKIMEVMTCPGCGGRKIHVEPVWRDGGGKVP